jgi:hypothetical protein
MFKKQWFSNSEYELALKTNIRKIERVALLITKINEKCSNSLNLNGLIAWERSTKCRYKYLLDQVMNGKDQVCCYGD